jgi:oxygen-independent coproporphyrinogen-3 oxidase
MAAIRGSFALDEDAEVTLEANPGTVSFQALQDLRSAGVNRLSLGVQSANGEELRMLERMHDFGDVCAAVADSRKAGFDNLNVDLIYGLPEQSPATWNTTLQRTLELRPDHVSAYCLTLEHGTPFGLWARRGLMPTPDPDMAAAMYELTERVLESAGYQQYEISNWATPGRQCRHNLQYWRGEPYLGFGAGAHGYAAGHRYSNVLAIRDYVRRLAACTTDLDGRRVEADPARPVSDEDTGTYPWSPAMVEHHAQSRHDEMADFMIMGLRLTAEGVTQSRFKSRFGCAISEIYGPPLARLSSQGLIEMSDLRLQTGPDRVDVDAVSEARIILTPRGRLLGNRVFGEFVN